MNFFLHSLVFRSYDVSANDDLHLGSDHRNVSNLRSVDEDGIVMKMIKHVDTPFKESLLHLTILHIMQKDRDLGELTNWGPIAFLPIFYKIFSKFIYNRISKHIFDCQCWDQHDFILDIRIEDALLCAEVIFEYHQEFYHYGCLAWT